MKDRQELIDMVSKMIADDEPTADIVDAIISELAPDDGYECPVCGICP